MAATATRPLTENRPPLPGITKETWAELAQERKRLAADPSQNPVAADLTVDTKYLFRTQPNTHRRLTHTLPMRPEESTFGDEKKFHFQDRRWQALVAEPWFRDEFPNLKRDEYAAKMSEMLEALRDELGGIRLTFHRVTGRNECFLATNSDLLAAYIRRLVKDGKGEFAQVYEVNPRVRWLVGDKAFPNTETGKRLAFQYAESNNIEDIKLVKE